MMDASTAGSRVPGSDPGSVSSTLLERLKARRPEAWERLVDLYGPVVYRWCRWSGVWAGDVPDVVQEVFTAISTDIADFRRQRPGDSFTGWMRTITRSKVSDHFRRQQGHQQAQGGTDAQEAMLRIRHRPAPWFRQPARGRRRDLAPRPGTGPRRVREPHLGGLLAGGDRRPIARPRRRGLGHERAGGLQSQIAGAPPPAGRVGGIAVELRT